MKNNNQEENPIEERYQGESGVFDKIKEKKEEKKRKKESKTLELQRPLKSVEGYLIMISNVHQECQEDDIIDAFGDFGPIKNLHLNLDRRTGYVKGYCMLEYSELQMAQQAITAMHNQLFLGQNIQVDWAFLNKN